jgi:hypothetical protein
MKRLIAGLALSALLAGHVQAADVTDLGWRTLELSRGLGSCSQENGE